MDSPEATTTESQLQPPLLQAFPTRTPSTSNLQCETSPHGMLTSDETPTFASTTRFAITDLIACILRHDFWDETQPSSILFCKMTFDIVVSLMRIPDRVARTISTHLEGEERVPDIVALVKAIEDDQLVKKEGAVVVLGSLLVAFLNSGNYDARYRVLLRNIGTLLCVVWEEFEEIEDKLAITILDEIYVESKESKRLREKSRRKKKIKRILLIGAAGGIGGVFIGLAGGLSAPLIASGAGALIGSSAAGLATTTGAVVLGIAFGVAGAGLAGHRMSKRVGAIEEFSLEKLSDDLSIHCALGVSGWIEQDKSCDEAFVHNWKHLNLAREQYTLRYESKYLKELGNSMDYITRVALSTAVQKALMETALAGLLNAISWPMTILSVSSVLDNPWNVCAARAAEVGEQLAEVLLSRSHGKRPISLVGFSLGARVIYHCLIAMNARTGSAGIIEDVILLGAPVTASLDQWAQVCRVVSGRVINGYCDTDWLLRFVYRTMSVQFTIAGTGPIEDSNNKKIFNYNLSHIVSGHLDYSRKLPEVLAAVGVGVKDLPTIDTNKEDVRAGAEEAEDDIAQDLLTPKIFQVECSPPSLDEQRNSQLEIK